MNRQQRINGVKSYLFSQIGKVSPYMSLMLGWNNSRVRMIKLLQDKGDLTRGELILAIDESLKITGKRVFSELQLGWTPYNVTSRHALAYAIYKQALSKEQIQQVSARLDRNETIGRYVERYSPESMLKRFLEYLTTEQKPIPVNEKRDDPHDCCTNH